MTGGLKRSKRNSFVNGSLQSSTNTSVGHATWVDPLLPASPQGVDTRQEPTTAKSGELAGTSAVPQNRTVSCFSDAADSLGLSNRRFHARKFKATVMPGTLPSCTTMLIIIILAMHAPVVHSQQATIDSLASLLRTQKPDTNRVNLLVSLSSLSRDRDKKGAAEYARQAVTLASTLPSHPALARARVALGTVLSDLRQRIEAREQLQHALLEAERHHNGITISKALRELGRLHADLGDETQALASYRQALEAAERCGDASGAAGIMEDIGTVHFNQHRYREALAIHRGSLRLREERHDDIGTASSLLSIASTWGEMMELDSAISEARRAYDIAKRAGSLRHLRQAAETLSRIHARRSDFASAFQFQIENKTLKDSLINESGRQTISVLTTRYKAEEREHQIALLERDKTRKDLESLRQQEELRRHELQEQQRVQELQLLGKEKEIQSLTLSSTDMELEQQRLANKKAANDVAILSKAGRIQTLSLEQETFRRNVSVAGAAVLLLLSGVIYSRYRYKKRTTEQLSTTLAQLTRTQAQLIHAEKMATLGEMTAGIAHEIKNPLNFMTNFSSLSATLAGELRERLDQISPVIPAEDHDEFLYLIDALQGNSEKIRVHGQRADTIIANMMMHARGQAGVRQRVAINRLVGDAVSLATAARRRDGHAAADIRTAYDPHAGEIDVLPQEMSRVIMNLVGNALYAVQPAAHPVDAFPGDAASGEDAEPTVWIATERRADAVVIRVRDNGPGVPEEIRE